MFSAILFAAEAVEEEGGHALFYIAGGLLALWAVLVSAVGIRGHANWPTGSGAANGIMGVSGVLVVFACAAAVITA